MIYTKDPEIYFSKIKLFEHSYEQIKTESHVKAIAVYYINIDGLSIINNSFGYACGDMIIEGIAKRLDLIRDEDTFVTHLLNDEFLIMQILSDETNIRDYSEKVLSIIEIPLFMQNDSIYITASIGVSTFPRHGKDIHSLVRRAKIALSYSKKTGKNRYHVFNELEDEELDCREKERYNIIKNLKNAIPENEFNILYQPIVSIPENRIVGAEALLRWNSKKLGAVPPGIFIPIAEETSEIIPIGEWVLDNVIEQFSKWHEMGHSQIRIAVNLSTCQLYDSSLINRLMGLKEIYPIDLGNIELEITESAMIRNFETAIQILDGLHKLGIKISIDDFGSGYSSLNYITSLVIDHVKVDKSYIDDITNICKKRLTVKAVIDLAHKMGIGVTAEGVEDTGQLQLLRKLRCDRYQGFVFSKPLEAQDFERLLAQQLQDG